MYPIVPSPVKIQKKRVLASLKVQYNSTVGKTVHFVSINLSRSMCWNFRITYGARNQVKTGLSYSWCFLAADSEFILFFLSNT
jgi:hypothetical protein